MKQNFRTHVMLAEDKIEWLKNHFKEKPFETDWDTTAEHHETDKIIDHFASHDPTPKKTNTQWMLGQYRKKQIRQEDAADTGETLGHFEKHKAKLEKKDINTYKDRTELNTAVSPHIGTAASRKEEKKGVGAMVHDHPDVKVFKIRNAEEATHFSKEATRATGVTGQFSSGTASWCTVAPNMYHSYADRGGNGQPNSNPLYVIHADNHPDPLKRRYQFDFHSQQYADANDRNQGLAQVVKDHPALRHVKEFEGKHPMLETPERLNQKVAEGHQYPGYQSAIKMDHTSRFLTADTLARAAAHGKNLPDIAGHPNAHPDLIHSLVLKDKSTHQAAAENHSAHGHTLQHIVDHNGSSDQIMTKVAEHPNATADVIGGIALKGQPSNSSTKKAAAHPNLPNGVREKLISAPEHHVNLLGNPSLSDAHVEAIAKHASTLPTGMVRNATEEKLASHPQTGTHHLDRLARSAHVNHLAASAALANKNTPASTFEDLSSDLTDKTKHAVHAAMAKPTSGAPSHILQKLTGHPLPFVATTAAKTLAARK